MGLLDKLMGGGPEPTGAPGEPRLDPCLGDGRARHLHGQLSRGDWKAASAMLERLKREDREFYAHVLSEWPGRPAWIDEWWASSCDTSVWPWLVRGRHSIRWAWEARSGRVAKEVGQDAFKVFFQRLQAAEADLWQAVEMDPQDAAPWAFLTITGRGLQVTKEEIRDRFAEAHRRDPESHLAHAMTLVALCEKWSGSHAQMFGFASQASQGAPAGSGLHSLVAQAHVERWLYFSMENDLPGGQAYFKDGSVQADVVDAWRRSFGSPACKPGRFAHAQRSEFGLCFYLMGERGLLREALTQLGPVVADHPWSFLGDPVQVVKKARASCGM